MSRSVSVPRDAEQVVFAAFEHDDEIWFQECIEEMRQVARARYPSLYPCDKWLGREDHAVLENALAYIVVSEYCGVVAVSAVPKGCRSLADAWCRSIDLAPLAACFGRRLTSLGVASNGEQLFLVAERR